MSEIKLQKNLNFLMKEQGRPLSKIASLAHMNKSTLHGYLNGVVPKSLWNLTKLADILGVEPKELLFGDLSKEVKVDGRNFLEGRFEITVRPLPPRADE